MTSAAARGSTAPPQRLWPVLLVGGSVVVVGLAVVALVWTLIGRSETAEADLEPAVSSDSLASASAPLPSNAVVAHGEDRPPLPDPGSPASSALQVAEGPRPAATRPRPGVPRVAPRAASSEVPVTRPAPSAKPERPAPSARPAENPFDKRF